MDLIDHKMSLLQKNVLKVLVLNVNVLLVTYVIWELIPLWVILVSRLYAPAVLNKDL